MVRTLDIPKLDKLDACEWLKFDDVKQTLTIKFRSGTYRYDNVGDEEVAQLVMCTGSLGEIIRNLLVLQPNKYPVVKLESHE